MIPFEIYQTNPTAGGDRNVPDTSNMPVYTGGGPEKLHAQQTREAETATLNFNHDVTATAEAFNAKVQAASTSTYDVPLPNGEVYHASGPQLVGASIILILGFTFLKRAFNKLRS